MSIKVEPDEPMRRALLDVVQSLQGLIVRTRGICELGAHSGRPMDPLVQRSRQLLETLEGATEIMSLFGDDPASLKINREGDSGRHEKIVLRCVNSVLESADADSGEALVGEDESERIDLRGSSWSIGVPELLSFLQTINKSGTVRVSTLGEIFTIVLNEGQVVHASSNSSPRGMRLGDILVSRGATTNVELQGFLRSRSDKNESIGSAFVRHGVVTQQELEDALEFQVQQLFYRLFDAEDATFSFYDGRTNTNRHNVRMNLTRLLLESSFEAEGEQVR